MKIDFHLHSKASRDCASDPEELVEWARRKGLDGLALTDHDTCDGYIELKRHADAFGLTVLPGIEVAVMRGTHYLVYFTPEPPLPMDDLELLYEVHRRGGLIGMAHPYRPDTGLLHNKEIKNSYSDAELNEILVSLDLIEAVNAKCPENENRLAMGLASEYPNLKVIGGSDAHYPAAVGSVHTDLASSCPGDLARMKNDIEYASRTIVSLPELQMSGAGKTIEDSIEGLRRLLLYAKPVFPRALWRMGKRVYASEAKRRSERRVMRSLKR
jgi:predicted metal-dependent phosphoesterase TrpH